MRKLPGQADFARFCGGIGLYPGQADTEPGAAGDCDDASGGGLFHAGNNRLRHQKGAGKIDAQDGVPIRGTHVLGGLTDLTANAAGAMHQNIDRTKMAEDSRDRSGVRHVEHRSGNIFVGHSPQPRCIAVNSQHARAGGR